MDPLDRFSPATATWFRGAFHAPTAAQAGAWDAIMSGGNALVVAPTGSGKTLAAFLAALDRLAFGTPAPDAKHRCRVLYVSPLKALAVDVERNLRAPLTGLRQAATRLGLSEPDVQIGVRSGDTPADARRRFLTKPPDIVITTPESLFLLLTSASRDSLRGVETVIVDEVHAVAGTKRGAHLALSLERLDALLPRPAQRIGLSATVRPVDEVARFLGGSHAVAAVVPPAAKTIELDVVVPVEDLSALDERGDDEEKDPRRTSVWPHVEARIADLVENERSTIVFANSRRLAERLCNRLNEIHHERVFGEPLPEAHTPAQVMAQAGAAAGAAPLLARAHHGSVSKEQRAEIEEALKAGRLPAVVATSSLELGIDMGAVDLVVQVEAPPSVASGLQRVGRAGHQVGAVSRGVVFPKYRGDLVQAAVVAERMRVGAIEEIAVPANPLDVLAQQVVAMTALDVWDVADMLTLVRRAAPFASLPESAFRAVLDMLSGRYPSDEFAELRPRIVWDRHADRISGRPGAQRLAVTSGGTIPDRGLFGVFLAGEAGPKGGRRVGELDEEMVYESRVGDVFTLGSTSWRIEDITHDKVLVSPAPGVPGRLPFWKGDTIGRPLELGRALGAFVREVGGADPAVATARLREAGLDEWAASNLLAYLREQKEATRHLPDDRTIVVERFRDELGDWRVVVHSPFGARVHAPWALAIGARVRERYGMDAQVMHADDGIVLRLPDTDGWSESFTDMPAEARGSGPPSADLALFSAGDIEQVVTDEIGGSALFAARFRECAGRALLLPRRRPGQRSPLWQQRQRSAQLLAVASRFGSFPIVLETVRECLRDVFDMPGLAALLEDIDARRVRMVEVETRSASPFARSLLFGYVAQYLYEGDSPLAERRAAALTLDSSLLAELLGQTELRDLLDADVIARTEAELQRLTPDRHVRDAEGTADLLRLLGPLTTDAARARGVDPAWLVDLEGARRVIRVRLPGSTTVPAGGGPHTLGSERWASIEDAGRLRDALGVALPVGVPEAFTEPVADPLGDLVGRFARTHGPFTTDRVAAEFGLGPAVAAGALRRLVADGRLVTGEFRPDASGAGGSEWCDAEVLRRIRRRTLAALRKEVEPVLPRALARMLPAWQSVGGALRGVDGVLRVVEQLAGVAVPASALERLILPARVAGYQPAMLDELTAAGEVVWAGAGTLAGNDGWLVLCPADTAPLLLPPAGELPDDEVHRQVLAALDGDAARFFRGIAERVDAAPSDVLGALWDLVWSGHVTNDTLAPVRALLSGGRTAHSARRAAPRARYARPRGPFGTRTGTGFGGGGFGGGGATWGDGAFGSQAGAGTWGGETGGSAGGGRTSAADGPRGGARADARIGDDVPDDPAGSGRNEAENTTGTTDRPAAGRRAGADAGDAADGPQSEAGITGGAADGPGGGGRAGARAGDGADGGTRDGSEDGAGSGSRGGAGVGSGASAGGTRGGVGGRRGAVGDPSGPTAVGRWSLLPGRQASDGVPGATRSRALADALLDRHGVLTRGAVAAERLPGGFASVYPVLAAFEEAGRCRRGYFVEGLGAAQFAMPGAVDHLRKTNADAERAMSPHPRRGGQDGVTALVLAATDPANAYGAALPWPSRPEDVASGHKPARKAGALVVLVDGDLVLYVERGGRTLLSWTEDPEVLQAATDALALAVRDGWLGRLTVARADGTSTLAASDGALSRALEQAGFHATPQGLRLRG